MKVLSEEEKLHFDNFIDSLTDEEKQNNICEECGKKLNILGNNETYLQDIGKCKVCGKILDVFNPKIIEEVFNRNIEPIEYWYSGCKRIVIPTNDCCYCNHHGEYWIDDITLECCYCGNPNEEAQEYHSNNCGNSDNKGCPYLEECE
ncbi:hypothetical protein [uncultured Clostridium sp.]|uniref:hypothetical protein n=1 Tax=uncultured Clostridium sp. TaxID=59620 RepID=UPI0028E747A3|nr:hypothetical protein [uncultured Clostridium sp.]